MTTGDQAGAPQKRTRYQRVKEILNEAQGDANPSYQGYKRFWELPLEEFLNITIYGIRMIASAGEADFCEEQLSASSASCCSCSETPAEGDQAAASASEAQPSSGGDTESAHSDCCGSAGTQPSTTRSPGRGAASGLIKGLKGEFPFDGSQFPRLPWGGAAVSSSDILFIQAWIDDGCPATDAGTTDQSTAGAGRPKIQAAHALKLALAQGHAEHPLSARPANAFRDDAGTIKVRKNIANLTPDELERFRRAIKTMQCYDDYQQYDQRSFRYWADIHANNCQHGWEQFLSWHRLYLYNFEQQIQDIDPTVTLPYWDWPQDRDDVLASIQDMKQDPTKGQKPFDNGVIPQAYRCWVDQTMLQRLKGKITDDMWLKLQSVEGEPFNSGNRLYIKAGLTFTGRDTDDLIMNELRRVNPLWNRNRWPGGDQSIIFEAYPTPEDIERILQIPNFFNFGSGPASNHFFGALENIHNLIHNFSGGTNPNSGAQFPNEPQYGDMISAGTTARDPIFWGHHSNVDRLWAEWQALHPGAGPDDPSDILAPWPLNVGQVLNISNLGYEYMKSTHLFETDSSIPIARFKSAGANVQPAVLAQHRQAEIHLHKVQYSTAGGAFIRVFLNEPDATTDTPTRGNDHFVAQVATFSGECMGGPGHCAPPPEKRRKFDMRPRHRKTPGNFRIDATETIGKLAAKGDTDFQIQLVVLGIDGQPKPDALRLDAVSLNFKD
ncbi:MAG: tyrosinase family protein [Roseiflexaceae bacterium]